MKIGVLKEIRENETRVALTPAGARALTGAGHSVRVQAVSEALNLMNKFREFF
jgi:alanine dehydrogenase